MIELKNIEKIYATANGNFTALKNINLNVPSGDIFGVVGKSGAGKSTLIRCVNLLERPTHGQVIVANQDLTTLPDQQLRLARHQIGMIFQHFNLLARRTVYENIALPLELCGFDKNQINNTLASLLELTELTDKKNSYPAELSGGQKQRVAIARALAYQPKVLLCDEATSALDPQTTKTILQLLKNINVKLGITILLITHEIEVIKEICDHVALLNNGEIIEQGELVEFFTKPKHALTKNFIKSSLKQELPAALQAQLITEKKANTNPVLRIIFHGRAASEPMIAHLMQNLQIKLNILQANIEFLKHDALGIMVAEIIECNGNLETGLAYLKTQDVNAEIIGYVERTVN